MIAKASRNAKNTLGHIPFGYSIGLPEEKMKIQFRILSIKLLYMYWEIYRIDCIKFEF